MKLLYLYHDLMNLYGERGNIACLARRLAQQGEPVEVDRRSVGDALTFDGYDFLYVGAGAERSQKVALEHLRPYGQPLKEALDRGMHALFTGNAAALLSQGVTDAGGETWPGLGLAPFTVREQKETRYTGDAIAVLPELDRPVVGYFNHCEDWEGEVASLFRMTMGRGNRAEETAEGLRQDNLLATHLIGPVLVKNPHLCRWLVERLLGRPLQEVDCPYEDRAWQVTYEALAARQAQKQ